MQMASRQRARMISCLLLALMLVRGVSFAQVLKAPEGAPQKLMITILEGEGALNNIRERDAREPIVQVTDENHKPVAGALILFTIHDGAGAAGGSASFAGAAKTISVTTGPDGTARATGLHPSKSGQFTITVAASVGAIIAAEVIIHQSNGIIPLSQSSSSASAGQAGEPSSATAGSVKHGLFHLGSKGKFVVGAGVVAAVAVVLVVVVSQNNSTSLSLGTSTVTHP